MPVAYGHPLPGSACLHAREGDVWIRGYVDSVVIGCGGEVIARHPRRLTIARTWSSIQSTTFRSSSARVSHGVATGSRPVANALDQAAPLAEWDLPPEFATLRRLMEARMLKAGRREYVQVLRLLETFGTDDLHAAIRQALRLGAVGFDAVKHLVLCQVEKRPPKLDLDVHPYLPRAEVETTSTASHMSLLSEDAA